MVEFWKYLSNIGVDDDLCWSEMVKVRLLNQFSIVVFVVSIIVALVRFESNPETFCIGIRAVLMSAIVYLLHANKNYITARYFACYVLPLTITGYICLTGGINGEIVNFFTVTLLAVGLYEKKRIQRMVVFLFILINSVFTIYYCYSQSNMLFFSDEVGSMFLFAFNLFLISMFIVFYQEELRINKQKQDELFVNLTNKQLDLERFAYVTSHDMKEPLRNIQAFSGLLRTSISKGETERTEEYLNIINTNAARMTNLVRDTLELSLFGYDKEGHTQIDLNEVVTEIKSMIGNTLAEKKVEILVESTLPTIFAVRQEILSCFKNIIENGIKYNHSQEPRLIVSSEITKEYHKFTIEDNGKGIQKENHDKIFELYTRLENRREEEGTGLGLSICKKIIEKYHGSIWVESNHPRGSKFMFTLPIVK